MQHLALLDQGVEGVHEFWDRRRVIPLDMHLDLDFDTRAPPTKCT